MESISYVGMQQSECRRKGSKRVLHLEDTRRTPGWKKYRECKQVMIVSAFCYYRFLGKRGKGGTRSKLSQGTSW